MRALTIMLAGGAAAAALASAVPADAQYYPGYPNYPYNYPQPGPVNPGYGFNQQAVTSVCANAVQARLNGGYGYRGYGYGGGRVLGISRVEQRDSGRGLRVWGVASSGYNYRGGPDLVWSCRTDWRGYVVDVDIKRGAPAYGYTPWGDNYAPYGYRRY
jgi:hypothetical protein